MRRTAERIAIPYYGQLFRPCQGLEKLYFILELTEASGRTSPRLAVWNADEVGDLPQWLRTIGVTGIICSDEKPHYLLDFRSCGIWVQWAEPGDVTEIVDRWEHEGARRGIFQRLRIQCAEPQGLLPSLAV
jgi:hypothetical protein